MLIQSLRSPSGALAPANARPALQVLVYLDGSVHAQAGAGMVSAFPLPPGSAVTLLAASTAEPRLAALLDAALGRATALWSGDNVTVKRLMSAGSGAQSIIAGVKSLQPDLVVLSAQRVASSVGRLLNGMVHQVMEQAPSPVLAALAPFTGLRRILLAYDGSPHSQAAARFLARLPLPPDIDVTLLHVVTDRPPVAVVPPRWPVGARLVTPRRAASAGTLDPALVQQAQDILAEGLALLSDAGLPARGRLACGEGAQVILQEAQAGRADLVVAGSRGQGALQGWLLGSVSRRLVQNAGQSVLIVREP